jgi:hypothetical protein
MFWKRGQNEHKYLIVAEYDNDEQSNSDVAKIKKELEKHSDCLVKDI